MKCKNCNAVFEDDDAIVDRDGDPYNPDTSFWYLCPYCLEPIDEE